MSRPTPRETARDVLRIVPLVMRTVAAQLRAAGELPAPAHFNLLTTLAAQPRTLTELATQHGVSLPTMSNSIARLVERGWARRGAAPADRRRVLVEITPAGRTTVDRVSRAAEAHLGERLSVLDPAARRRLRRGLAVLRQAFARDPLSHAAAPGQAPGFRRPKAARAAKS